MQAAAYSDRSKAIHIWARALWLAGLIACFWFAGCGQSADTGPEAEKLRKEMSRTLGGLSEKVEPLLAKDDADGIHYLLKEKFNAAAKDGKPLNYALAVLSNEGRVVAGRYPEPDGKNHRKTREGFNFGQYDSFKKVLGGKSAGCLLYAPQGTTYGRVHSPAQRPQGYRHGLHGLYRG